MNITIIITGLNTGGAEVMLLKLLERLSPRFSIHVISLTDIGPIGQRMKSLGISVTALNMIRGVPDPIALFRLSQLLRRQKPDIVHTWMYHADLLGGLAARLAGVPSVIWNIRHSDLSKEKTKITTRLVAGLCARLSSAIPDCIECCSMVAQDIHIALGYAPGKFVVIPNGFDLESFQPDLKARKSVRQELGIADDKPLVGLIARFNPQKNHLGFFEAVSHLHQKKTDVHFLLAGRDIDNTNNELVESIHQANVNHVTHLLGLRNDIPRLMASLDVLVSASTYGEGFPNVLGEAMACGIPCVTTDVGDSAYIVKHTGKVVAPDDMVGLSMALDNLLSLPLAERSKLGQQARLRIRENFKIEQVVNLYQSEYQRLYSTRGPVNV